MLEPPIALEAQRVVVISMLGRRPARLALTDERLQEIEAVRAAVASLGDSITRARNRAVARAVAARWPYKRIQRATGLSISRIGQIAPARAGRDPAAEPTAKPTPRRQRK